MRTKRRLRSRCCQQLGLSKVTGEWSIPDRNPQPNSHLTEVALPWASEFELCTPAIFTGVRPGRYGCKGRKPENRKEDVYDGERVGIGKSLGTIEHWHSRQVDEEGYGDEALWWRRCQLA